MPIIDPEAISSSCTHEPQQPGLFDAVPVPPLPAVVTAETCGGFIDAYLEDRKTVAAQGTGLATETLTTYRKHLTAFSHWWQTPPVRSLSLSTSTLKAYYDHLAYTGLTKRSRDLRTSSVRQFCLFLQRHAYVPAHTFHELPPTRKHDQLAFGYLTRVERERFLLSFQREKLLGHRNYLMARLMLETAIRETELCQVNISDLNEDEACALLTVKTKGQDRHDDLRVGLDLYHNILTYLHARREHHLPSHATDPLFSRHRTHSDASRNRLAAREVRFYMKQAFAKAGIHRQNISTTSLRHTAAVHAFFDGQSLEAVQRFMRHASEETTRVYQDLARRAMSLSSVNIAAARDHTG